MAEQSNMLRVTLDDDEADYLLKIVTMLSGGEPLTEREQLILLLGVRFMQRRDVWIDTAIERAVHDAIDDALKEN